MQDNDKITRVVKNDDNAENDYYFYRMDFSALKPGDLFFFDNDVKFTLENGEYYLDFQIREKREGRAPIIDCGGCVLIDEYWQNRKNDFDFDNGGKSNLFDFLTGEIDCRLDYFGIPNQYNISKTAAEILKKNLWYFE